MADVSPLRQASAPTAILSGDTLERVAAAAGRAADGQTRVLPLETVEPGYSQFVERLLALGAKVAKVE